MSNVQNLRPVRSKKEARERGRKGGKASGEVRRRKADFRRILNLLLTTKIDIPELTYLLESMGMDSTLESALNMAMIKEALGGNVKAARYVAEYSGQSKKADEDIANVQADIELKQARKQDITGENETGDALERLDAILKTMRERADGVDK